MRQPLSAGLSVQGGRCASSKVPFPVAMSPGLCSPALLLSLLLPKPPGSPFPVQRPWEVLKAIGKYRGFHALSCNILLTPPGSCPQTTHARPQDGPPQGFSLRDMQRCCLQGGGLKRERENAKHSYAQLHLLPSISLPNSAASSCQDADFIGPCLHVPVLWTDQSGPHEALPVVDVTSYPPIAGEKTFGSRAFG